MVYNLLSCSGFADGAGCIKGRLAIVLLFFILAILRKWGGEEIGISFNFIFALLFGVVPYFLVMTLTGNLGWAMGIGLLGGVLGGYGGGIFFGGEEY